MHDFIVVTLNKMTTTNWHVRSTRCDEPKFFTEITWKQRYWHLNLIVFYSDIYSLLDITTRRTTVPCFLVRTDEAAVA